MTLSEAQRELVADEAQAFLERAEHPAAQDLYRRLVREAEAGEVSEELAAALGGLLGAGLMSGRIRAVYGAHAELEAERLFHRTPQGRELDAQFEAANKAFAALEGQAIHKIRFSARGPGMYTVVVETDRSRVVTSLSPAGVDVRSVEIAL